MGPDRNMYLSQKVPRRYMAELMPIERKTISNQSINLSINQKVPSAERTGLTSLEIIFLIYSSLDHKLRIFLNLKV